MERAYKKSMPATIPTTRFSLLPRRPKYLEAPNMVGVCRMRGLEMMIYD
jgi:hypothetical protein